MPAQSPPIVETRDLNKIFGRQRALSNLNLSVTEGEVHGFLGPNGAGKSTTIRVLLGLVRASSGSSSVFGLDPWARATDIHRDLAYVPGDVNVWPNLSGGEIVDLLTSLRGGADAALRTQLVSDFEFDARKKARAYSKGNRQKVALIAAFARRARLYIFDEPSSGLDPLMEEVFRSHVERVRSEGATVLLSSHILSEVEQLCDRVTIIREGSVVESGTLAELRHLSRTHFRVSGVSASRVGSLPGVRDVSETGDSVEFDVDAASVRTVLSALSSEQIIGLSISPVSLESLFMRHYEGGRAA